MAKQSHTRSQLPLVDPIHSSTVLSSAQVFDIYDDTIVLQNAYPLYTIGDTESTLQCHPLCYLTPPIDYGSYQPSPFLLSYFWSNVLSLYRKNSGICPEFPQYQQYLVSCLEKLRRLESESYFFLSLKGESLSFSYMPLEDGSFMSWIARYVFTSLSLRSSLKFPSLSDCQGPVCRH